MTKMESSLLWSLERGLGIALQAVLEKKAVILQRPILAKGMCPCLALVPSPTAPSLDIPQVQRKGSHPPGLWLC